MRFPSECYQIHQTLRQTMPNLAEPGKWTDPTCEPLDSLSVAIPAGARVADSRR